MARALAELLPARRAQRAHTPPGSPGPPRSRPARPLGRRGSPARHIRFRHILIRDAAYTPAEGERAVLHERFADWLEAGRGATPGEYEEIVGYHLEQAHRYRIELGEIRPPPDRSPTGRRPHRPGRRAADSRGDPQPPHRAVRASRGALLPPGRQRIELLINLTLDPSSVA